LGTRWVPVQGFDQIMTSSLPKLSWRTVGASP
jgi:hypothetical protein